MKELPHPIRIAIPARHLVNCTMSDMEVDHPAPKGKEKKEAKPRFEVKKVRLRSSRSYHLLICTILQWNAVALWAWGVLS